MSNVIYIGCPYTGTDDQKQKRYEEVTSFAAKLVESGNIVYSPITHSHPIESRMNKKMSSGEWVKFDAPFMEICNRMIVVMMDGWENSLGLRHEIAYFRSIGIEPEFIESKI